MFSSKLSAQDPACIPVVTFTASQNNICVGTAVTFHATVVNDGTSGVYKWKKNNKDVTVNNKADYTTSDLRDGDLITCEYSCKTTCGIDTTVKSNPALMRVTNDIIPTITIANNDSIICEGEPTIFTSKSSYGNELPSYQWLVNGSDVGNDSPDYVTSSLKNGSQVKCILTISTPQCGGSKSSSSEITIYVYPMIHPAITIVPVKTEICRGETATFTATANGGASPLFTWQINGVSTGENASSFSSGTLKDGDTVSCTITIDQDSRCHTSTSAPSNVVVMHVHDFTDPTLKITAPVLNVCAGTPVTFAAIAENAPGYKFYQWQVNGKNMGSNSVDFTYQELANGDIVSCKLSTAIPGCAITETVYSNKEVVAVKQLPVITFLPPQISVILGEATQINASVSDSAASFIWEPSGLLITPQSLTSSTLPLIHDTIFNLSVVGTNGCLASKDLAVKILYKQFMPSAFTPNGDGKNDVFRIPVGSSLSLRQFSIFDRWGNVVFSTKDITNGWNGALKGQDLDTGTYIYLIEGSIENKKLMLKGTVTLIR